MIKTVALSIGLFITTANFTMLQEEASQEEFTYKIHAATVPLKKSEIKKDELKSKPNRCCMLFLDCLISCSRTPSKLPLNIQG